MKEKLESLPLTELRVIAKNLNIKRVTGVKKAELINAIIAADKSESVEEVKADKPKQTRRVREKKPQKSEQAGPAQNTENESVGEPLAEWSL